MCATTKRAYDIAVPSLFSDEITASLFRIEMIDEGNEGIEM
jgi:hypothetical protein